MTPPSDDSRGWLSVRVRPGTNREGVVAALFSAGAQSVQEVGEELVTLLAGDTPADVVTCAVLAASADARIETAPAPNVDWTEQWKRGVRAQELGPLVIAPPWLASEYEAARTVVIDPGMAFGTGEHPTTRGVVRLLTSVIRQGDRVADLGAGSAVLAIASVKLGAAHAVAIEIDPDAIGNAESNVARNGVSDRVTVLEGDARLLLPLVAPVRVIVANIISSVLVELLPVMSMSLAPDGEAIMSGILTEERSDLISVLASNGWRLVGEDREDVWWSAVISRR
jgi:ribosomal protein L11 methyltransferase